jgi:hypothetical protein
MVAGVYVQVIEFDCIVQRHLVSLEELLCLSSAERRSLIRHERFRLQAKLPRRKPHWKLLHIRIADGRTDIRYDAFNEIPSSPFGSRHSIASCAAYVESWQVSCTGRSAARAP